MPSLLKLPAPFEQVITSYVKKTYYKGTRKAGFSERPFSEGDYHFFKKGVARMSAYFTVGRSELPKNYFNQKDLRSGYLLYFLPVNALKTAALLQQIPDSFFKTARRVLDLGAGPATASIGALLRAGPQWSPSLTLVDQNRQILQTGQELITAMAGQKLCSNPPIKRIVGEIDRGLKMIPNEPYDLILMANVLNEMGSLNKRLKLLRQLSQHYLAPEGRIVIIEPALRLPTRELMALRDELLRNEIGFVHAPCLHQEDCPMYADNQRDWCHMYWEWERPELIEQMDELVGIRKDYLKASYLILGGRRGESLEKNENQWRVVSGRLNSKGKSERLLCGVAGLPHLQRVMRLDRDQSKENQDFDRAMRGDIVETQAKSKLGKSDKFSVVSDPS